MSLFIGTISNNFHSKQSEVNIMLNMSVNCAADTAVSMLTS